MNTEFTRQYKLPKPISNKTASLIKIAQQQPLVIPDAQDLQTIKTDLEILLPLSETRAIDLKKGLHSLHGNIKIQEGQEEKTRIKQEPDDFTETVFTPKNEQQSRQAALETIRRRRRKEELEEGTRHSEPPQVKLKQHGVRGYESMSPPSELLKKKKQGIHARAQDEPDFTRVKAKDQVPITTFWTTIDPFFRSLTEEDRIFLMERADTSKAFWIPPLGEHYVDQWSREDLLLQTKLTRPPGPPEPVKLRYIKEPMTEDHLLSDDLTSGALTERLLSSLVPEQNLPKEIEENEIEEPEDEEWEDEEDSSFSTPDFEERLKRELRYAGLLIEDDADWNAKEDDEICAELRALGRGYKEQVEINDFRKKKLLEIVDNQLQFEQYRHVLDTLDTQVEQGYIKRFRNQKSKKRKVPTGQRSTLSENAIYVMEKRKAWIDALGAIFESKNQTMPSSSIYTSDTIPPVEEND